MRVFTFQPLYFRGALALLGLELGIGLYAHDALVRPYGGDLLAVGLLYCLAKSFVRASVSTTVLVVVGLACWLEAAQYAGLLAWLGWQKSWVARLVLGSQFAWGDVLAYALGAGCVLGAEWAKNAGTGARRRTVH